MSPTHINFLKIIVLRYSPDKILKLKLTTTGQSSNLGNTMTFLINTPNRYPTKYQLPTSYSSGDIAQSTSQDFKGQDHYTNVKGQIRVTP